jgi:hypothetical protein
VNRANALADLIRRLHDDASVLARYEDTRMASACQAIADEIQAALADHEESAVSLRQAAELGGYTPEHLGRLIREGKIENAGRKNAPRIRRRDVPVKPGFLPPTDPTPQLAPTSTRQIVRAVANSVE